MSKTFKVSSIGSQLVIERDENDSVTIERGSNSRPFVSEQRGAWTDLELTQAKSFWPGSEAHRQSRME